MARVRISAVKVFQAAVQSPGYDAFAVEKTEELKAAAIAVFESRQRKDNEHRLSVTTPPKYIQSFEIERDDNGYRLVNTDRSAVWVEFGAHVGGNRSANEPSGQPPMVLKYRPLGTALDVVAAREGAT